MLIKDIFQEYYQIIIAEIITFISGVGIGAAITDAINRDKKRGK